MTLIAGVTTPRSSHTWSEGSLAGRWGQATCHINADGLISFMRRRRIVSPDGATTEPHLDVVPASAEWHHLTDSRADESIR